MFVIVSKKEPCGTQRGYELQKNHCVSYATRDELEDVLNKLANEGGRGDHHMIISVMWVP